MESATIGNSISYFFHPKDLDDIWVQKELELQYRGKNDPERPPKREPGDMCILIGTIVGFIAGGILGALWGSFSGSLGGIIAGGIIGATIGALIKKRRDKTKSNAQKPF